jgi:hypothetical protein
LLCNCHVCAPSDGSMQLSQVKTMQVARLDCADTAPCMQAGCLYC